MICFLPLLTPISTIFISSLHIISSASPARKVSLYFRNVVYVSDERNMFIRNHFIIFSYITRRWWHFYAFIGFTWLTHNFIYISLSGFRFWTVYIQNSLRLTSNTSKRWLCSSSASSSWSSVKALMLSLSRKLHFTKQW